MGRSWKVLGALLVVLVIQGLVLSIAAGSESEPWGYRNVGELGLQLFAIQAGVMLGMVTVVFPAFSATAISVERDRKTLDMLILSPLQAWELISGKLFSAMSVSMVFLVASMPFLVLTTLFGSIPGWWLAGLIVAYLILSLMISAIGIYSSVTLKRPLPSLIVTYIGANAIGILTAIPLVGLAVDQLSSGSFSVTSRFFALVPVGARVFMVCALATAVLLYFLTFIMLTVARLKSSSENRYTPLRVLAAASVLTLITYFQIAFHASREFIAEQAREFPDLLAAVVFVLFLPFVFTSVKAIGSIAFGPRRVRQQFAEMQVAKPWKKAYWPVMPGSANTLVLALVLTGLMVVNLGAATNIAYGDMAESPTLSLASHERLLSEAADFGSDAASYQLNQVVRFGRNYSGPMLSSHFAETELKSHVLSALELASRSVWKLGAVSMMSILAFGLLAWWMALAFRRENTAGIVALLLFGLAVLGPIIADAVLSPFAESGLRHLSPLFLLANEVDATSLAQAEMIIRARMNLPGANGHLSEIQRLQSEIGSARLAGWGILVFVAALGGLLVWRERRKALVMIESAGGRWPPVKLPPPREFQVSRQTNLNESEG